MSVENLDKIFRPDSIAVIGAGERQGSIGAALMRNLIQGGFAGEIYPINPKHGVIMKMPAYPSVKDNCSNVVCQLRRNAELKK